MWFLLNRLTHIARCFGIKLYTKQTKRHKLSYSRGFPGISPRWLRRQSSLVSLGCVRMSSPCCGGQFGAQVVVATGYTLHNVSHVAIQAIYCWLCHSSPSVDANVTTFTNVASITGTLFYVYSLVTLRIPLFFLADWLISLSIIYCVGYSCVLPGQSWSSSHCCSVWGPGMWSEPVMTLLRP